VVSKVVLETDVDVEIEVMVKTGDVVTDVIATVELVCVTMDVEVLLKVAKLTDVTVRLPLVLIRVKLLVLDEVEMEVVVEVLTSVDVKVTGTDAITVSLDSSVVEPVVKDVVVVAVKDVLISVTEKAGTLEICKSIKVVSSVDKEGENIVVVSKELTVLYDVTVETHESTM
jgi:hypothetical protein